MQKVILITGASSGFGLETAHKLLDTKEWIVYAAARSVDKMKPLANKGAKIFEVDITEDEPIRNVVDEIIKNEGKIDVLLANAGFGAYGMIEELSIEEIKYQFDVNVFGVARSLHAVLPHMRKQKSGRIIITESVVSHISTLAMGWYAATKHALKAVSTALRQEVKNLGIEVVVIEPGAVNTGFPEVAFKSLKDNTKIEDYKEISENFYYYLRDSYDKSPTPESTAKAMFKAVTSKKPKLVYRTTRDAKTLPYVANAVPYSMFDKSTLNMVEKAGKKHK